MCVMTIKTTTRTRLVRANMPVLLGLGALLLISSVWSIILRIRSRITRIRLIFSAFPLVFGGRMISLTLLYIYLPLRGRWLLLRGLRRKGRKRC